jgi:hypothetical protein
MSYGLWQYANSLNILTEGTAVMSTAFLSVRDIVTMNCPTKTQTTNSDCTETTRNLRNYTVIYVTLLPLSTSNRAQLLQYKHIQVRDRSPVYPRGLIITRQCVLLLVCIRDWNFQKQFSETNFRALFSCCRCSFLDCVSSSYLLSCFWDSSNYKHETSTVHEDCGQKSTLLLIWI